MMFGAFNRRYWMKQWKQYILAATLVASTAFTSVALGADGTAQQQKAIIGGSATLPATVKMVELSKTNMVPYLLKDFEQHVKTMDTKSSAKGVAAGTAMTGEEAYKQAQADKATSQAILAWLDAYRLGEKSDVYQWQVKDAEGRKTAQIIAVKLDDVAALIPGIPLQLNGVKPKVDESTVDAGMFMLNMQINESRKNGQPFLYKSGTLGDSIVEEQIDYTVQVDNLMPLQKLTSSRYPTYTTSANVLYGVGGFEQAYYVQPTVVLTKNEPVLYVMITSDIEKTTFAPIFTSFIGSLK